MYDKKPPPNNKTIVQSNIITSARYDYTACQLDIFFMILGSLSSQPTNKKYRIYSKDIEDITGRRWDRKMLRESVTALGDKKIEINVGDDDYKQIWLFQSSESFHGQGYFEVMLSESIIPYLEDLKNNFTVMELKSALLCSSKYSKRLYALACQWRNSSNGRKSFKISELKEMLGLKDPDGIAKEQYIEIPALKKYVFDIAVKQINLNTDINFDYRLIKQGRSFTGIEIFIEDKELQERFDIDFNKDLEYQKKETEYQKNVAEIMAYGLDRESAEKIALKHFKDFKATVDDLNLKISQDIIKIRGNSSAAYLIGVYKKKGVLKAKAKTK